MALWYVFSVFFRRFRGITLQKFAALIAGKLVWKYGNCSSHLVTLN